MRSLRPAARGPGDSGSGSAGGEDGFADIAGALAHALETWVAPRPAATVRGGCINDAFRWESGAGTLFVKLAHVDSLEMFEAEAAGLIALDAADAVRVPQVLAHGAAGEQSYLALEFMALRPLDAPAERLLGQQLAAQHRQVHTRFGWQRDNTIGRTPQPNAWADDWCSFFIRHRLAFQLGLAQRNGHGGRLQQRGDELLARVPDLLAGHAPPPSLLHGDLWAGNAAADAGGNPVIFDPAVYYGDRESDLAMMRLFGGFGPAFFEAYESAWPLPSGAHRRVDLYNLYHVLNHLNLFGAGYLGQAMSLIDSLLASDR